MLGRSKSDKFQGFDLNPLTISGFQKRNNSVAESSSGEDAMRRAEYIEILKSFSIGSNKKNRDHDAAREENIAIIKGFGIDMVQAFEMDKMQVAPERETGVGNQDLIVQLKGVEIRRPHTSQGIYHTDETQGSANKTGHTIRLEIDTTCSEYGHEHRDVMKRRVVCKSTHRLRASHPSPSDSSDLVWLDGMGLVDDCKADRRAATPDFFSALARDKTLPPAQEGLHPSDSAMWWISRDRIARARSGSGGSRLGRRLADARAQLAAADVHMTQLDRARLCLIEPNQPHVLSLGRMPARPGAPSPTDPRAPVDPRRLVAEPPAPPRSEP
jgi:hypothetical protein